MRMHRLLKNRSKRISLAPVCRALKKEMRTLVGAPHGGAARLRRTSVLPQAKPRRRAYKCLSDTVYSPEEYGQAWEAV